MADHTGIEWTDATWNPVRGCRRVSEGCRNCYAELVAARFSGPGQPYEGLARMTDAGPRWTGEGRFVSEHLGDPLRWQRPRHVFVNSMSDLFFEAFTDVEIAAVFGVMALARQHTFQVLTKRPERMRDFLRDAPPVSECIAEAGLFLGLNDESGLRSYNRLLREVQAEQVRWPLPNVWLGTSVEHQKAADERIPRLLDTPAAVRFLSCEPLLGPVDLRVPLRLHESGDCGIKSGTWLYMPHNATGYLHWVIAGGESGPNARPMNPDWARVLRDQCSAAGVAFFFKQWGEWIPSDHRTDLRPGTVRVTRADAGLTHVFPGAIMHRVGKRTAGRSLDGRTWSEMPEPAHA